MAPPRATRDQLLADPRSGVTAGAARGGPYAAYRDPPAGASRRGAARPRTPAPVPPDAGDDDDDGDGDGGQPAARPARQRRQPAARPARALPFTGGRVTTATVTQQGAGLVVAAFAWPLAVNLLKGGPAAMWGWVKAKFINQPSSAAPSSSNVQAPKSTKRAKSGQSRGRILGGG